MMSKRTSLSLPFADAHLVADRLQRLCTLRPTLAIVLGSGFAQALSGLRVAVDLPLAKLPEFPVPGVVGHEGRLTLGYLGPTPVLALSGRAHFYEGYPMEVVTLPVRVLAAFGIRDLLLTNAAGGINRRFKPGDFMVLRDHLNFMGVNPLRGETPPDREKFVDLTETYDPALAKLMKRAAKKAKVRLHEGVYLAVSGPSYETPAEIRVFAQWGADAVGMSTVPEALVARQCGLAVAGLSCITNLAAGRNEQALSHAQVLAVGKQVRRSATELLREFCELYAHER